VKRATALVALGLSMASCASPPAPHSKPATPVAAVTPEPAIDPRWEDALLGEPGLLAAWQPRALLRDPVYGPLLRRLYALAVERNPAVASAHSMEAIESSDTILVAMPVMDPDSDARPYGNDDVVVVLRGVRADLDPARIVGDDGKPVWQPTSDRARIPEYVREEGAHGSSLFVLPRRTWVVANGPARTRAREAFAVGHSGPRTVVPELPPDALLAIRLNGPALVARVRQLRGGGPLRPVGRDLDALTLALPPGNEGTIVAHLTYANQDAAVASETVLRDVLAALRRSRSPRLRWIGEARLERTASKVTAHGQLPPALLDYLVQAAQLEVVTEGNGPTPAKPPEKSRAH
jgi:hypothetical protein